MLYPTELRDRCVFALYLLFCNRLSFSWEEGKSDIRAKVFRGVGGFLSALQGLARARWTRC